MFCSNCGSPLEPGSKFCPNCGTPVPEAEAPAAEPVPEVEVPAAEPVQPETPAEEPVLVVEPTPVTEPVDNTPLLTLDPSDAPRAPEPPVVNTTPPVPPPPPVNNGGTGTPPNGGISPSDMTLLLRIVFGLLGAAFAVFALVNLSHLLMFLFNRLELIGFAITRHYHIAIVSFLLSFVVYLVLDLLAVLIPALAAAVLLLGAAKWDTKYNDLVFGGVAAAAVLRLALVIVRLVLVGLLGLLFGGFGGALVPKHLLYFLGYVAAAGIVFLVMYIAGCPPIMGKNADQVKASVRAAIDELKGAFKKPAAGAAGATAAGAAKAAYQRTEPTAQSTAQPAATYVPRAKKTNRSLLMYILLNIITCGIYSYIFIYGMAQDANEVCDGDGQKTGGLVAFILLGMVTCGIYQLVWWYKLCNRMAANAPRYGLTFQENGTTFLLWQLFGALLCGIGPFIAMHIAIKNMNTLCAGYNQHNGFYDAASGASV